MTELASSSQLRAAYVRWCLVTVPSIVFLGYLSGLLAGSSADNPWFAALTKPRIFPPLQTFGIVWMVLYVVMGLAFALLITARGAARQGLAIGLFGGQLLLNLCWSHVFFGMNRISAALGLIGVLDVVLLASVWAAWTVRPRAGMLLVPYLCCCLFATLLNWQLLQLNPDADGPVAVKAGVN